MASRDRGDGSRGSTPRALYDSVDEESRGVLHDDGRLAERLRQGKNGGDGLFGAAWPSDDLDERHAMDGIEEMHSRHPRGIRRLRGNFTDRDRGSVRGEDGVSRHDALPLLEDRALDGELFHDGFDRDFAAGEAAVVETPGEKRH